MTLYFILGFLGICILGCLFHFVFDWTNHNKYIATFVAVNESVWEHIKLGIVPTTLWLIVGLFIPELNNFAFGAFIAFLTFQIVIPVIFYTYTFFTKKSILVVDILSFVVTVGLAVLFSYFVFTAPDLGIVFEIIGYIGVGLTLVSLPIFTYYPPKIALFKDPITNKYSIEGHSKCIHHEH